MGRRISMQSTANLKSLVEIESGRINGNFPKRALAHVLEWKDLHRAELLEAWSLARASQPLPRIDPLE